MDSLIINNLSKTYSNGVRALQDISLEVPMGMFGLLGPNGAGKSTLMRTIATLQEPDAGTISFGNLDVLKQKDATRRVLGYLPQEFGVYPKISSESLLNHLAALKGIYQPKERKEIVEALLVKTNLYEHRKKKLGGYSGGMKQRFGIAQALLANPKLIIVDEPTAGLDPAERNRFYNLLSELGEEAVVILSTHIVEDVKELCSHMAVINGGRVLMKANPTEAIDELQGQVFSKSISKDELEDYKSEYKVIAEKFFMGKPIIHVLSQHDPGNGFKSIPTDLEDVYFSQIFDSSISKVGV